jgi:hypothetical protein
VWYNHTSETDEISIGYKKETYNSFTSTQEVTVNTTTAKKLTLNVSGRNYSLLADFLNITDQRTFNVNDAYQFIFKMRDATFLYPNPSVINTKNASSFVIINMPSNATLQGLDSDSDGVTDFNELYTKFTDPFFNDTDNDGVTDNCDAAPNDPSITTNTCGNTCTYGGSGDWYVDCKDNCTLSSTTVSGLLRIYSTGPGNVSITNVNYLGSVQNYTHSCFVYWYGIFKIG